MAVSVLEEKKLTRYRNRLSSLEKLKRVAKPVVGIINGTFWGSLGALGSVSALHNVAGHAEFASRYLGATEAVFPIALQVTGVSLATYGAIALAEKIQQSRVSDMETSLKWKQIMSIDKSEPVQSQQQEKIEINEIAQENVQQKESVQYKPFSNVLKPRVHRQDHVQEQDMNM